MKEIVEDVWWEIDFQWDKYILRPIRNVKNLFRNIWTFRKVLYKYRWFDWSYLVETMIVVLKDMEHNTRNKGCHLRNEEIADSMRKSWLMLESTQQDHLDVFNFVSVDKNTPDSIFGTRIDKKSHVPFSKKYMLAHQDRMEDQNIKIAFEYLSKHLTSYWD